MGSRSSSKKCFKYYNDIVSVKNKYIFILKFQIAYRKTLDFYVKQKWT